MVQKAATVGYAALGVGIAAAMIQGVKGAADLEMALVNVRNATGATVKQMDMMRQVAFNISSITGQSVVDSAHILAVMGRASGGVFSPADLAKVAIPAAKFADVQFFSRGVPFETGAQWGIILAHMFRQYDPAGVTGMLDKMTRLSEMMPHDLGKSLTQMSYYLPVFKGLGVSDDSSVAVAALLDRFTGARRGGTWVADFALQALGPLQMTKHLQAGKGPLLRQMGILGADNRSLFFDRHTQKYDFLGLMRQIAVWSHGRDKDYVVSALRGVFGAQGGRFAMLAMDPKFIGQLDKIIGFLHRRDMGLDAQQARLMDTLKGRFQQFTTNFANVFIELASPWLGSLKNTFHVLADGLHNFQVWLHQHPFAEKVLGVGMTGVATTGSLAAMALLGGYGFAGLGVGARGMGGFANLLFGTRFGLGAAMGGAGGGAGLIGGAIGWLGPLFTAIRPLLIGGAWGLAAAGLILFLTHLPQIGKAVEDAGHWLYRRGVPAIQTGFGHLLSTIDAVIQSWLNQAHQTIFGTYFDHKKHPGVVGAAMQGPQSYKAALDSMQRGAGAYNQNSPLWQSAIAIGSTLFQHWQNLTNQDKHEDDHRRSIMFGDSPGSVHIGNVTVNLNVDPHGSPASHAEAVGNAIRNLRTAGRTSGDRSPGLPAWNPYELGGVVNAPAH